MEDHQTITKIKEEVFDIEFQDVSQDVHQLCTACLCATRTTRTLDDDALKQYYMHILTEMQPEGGVVLQSPRVCWECASHLKRAVRFREQVQDSYRLLQPIILTADYEDLNKLVPSSVCRPGRLKTCVAYHINLSPRDQDALVMSLVTKHDDDASKRLEYNTEKSYSSFQATNAVKVEDAYETLSDLLKREPNVSEKHYQCNVCEKIFSVKKKYLDHKIVHGAKSLQCEMCYKSFAHKGHFMRHKRRHTGEKPFHCEVCYKSFAQKCDVVRHSRVHTGERPFQCEMCHKPFTKKSDMIKHERIHTGEKPFQCEMCHTAFAQKGDLIRHRRLHSNKKPFQCEMCHKPFAKKSDLIKHIRTHTGEKPYQCEVCPKSFAEKGALVKHKRIHTGEKPYQCEECLKSFSEKGTLIRHKRLHVK